MGNTLHVKTLVAAVGIALIGGAAGISNDAYAAGSIAGKIKVAEAPQTYIIAFAEEGLLHYKGGVSGFAPTANRSSRKLDTQSAAAVAYSQYLQAQRDKHVQSISAALGRTPSMSHSYAITMNGVAAELSPSEAERVASLPGVRSVTLSHDYTLDTFRGPEFIGADTIWDGSSVPGNIGKRGEGVVVGVIDSGAFAAHPSFADDPACGFGPGNPKLITARDCLTSSGGLCTGSNPEANADNGHGVHTASTAAGNTLDSSAVPPPVIPAPFTTMSGVAPCSALRTYKVCATSNCSGAAIAAGIENAIVDGVDVINFSISGGRSPWSDNDRAFLDAVGADIFVAASAGNTRAETPNPVGEVNHLGPWMMTVAASTHDRNVAGFGSLSVTGPGTPPGGTTNISLNPGSGPNVGSPLTNAEIRWSADNPIGCTDSGGFPPGYFNNAIALISRGTCSFEEKVNNAEAAGALVAVIYNNTTGAINMNVGGASLPAYSILQAEGTAISNFIVANGATPTTANFGPAQQQGDVLADFSLRGPSSLPTVTKPDITGPGVNIYAAVTAGTTENYYGFNSGTSMSSPHLAGAAALLRSVHPDWTPAEVKSAIMLTASVAGNKEDLVTPWDADDVGSGRVDLTKAARTGLVMNETYENFVAANPATSGDPRTLNIPSMRDMECVGTCSWTRTVRNPTIRPTDPDVVFADGFDGGVVPVAMSWTATGNGATGLSISVSPSTFTLDENNPEQTLTITATVPGALSNVTFGDVVLHEANGLAPDARMTVAVKSPGGSSGGGFCEGGSCLLQVDTMTSNYSGLGCGTSSALCTPMLWLNQFSVDPSEYPITLNTVRTIFSTTGTAVGDVFDVFIYQDNDGDPSNGATFVTSVLNQTVPNPQNNFKDVTIPGGVVLSGPGDVLIALVNRTPTSQYPASWDTGEFAGKSWLALEVAPASGTPNLATLDLVLNSDIDPGLTPHNYIIRGIGTNAGGRPIVLGANAGHAKPPKSTND